MLPIHRGEAEQYEYAGQTALALVHFEKIGLARAAMFVAYLYRKAVVNYVFVYCTVQMTGVLGD